MKDADIEILGEINEIFRKHVPLSEYDVYTRFMDFYERMKAQNDLQKQQYQEKAEYHREKTRRWRQDNKERNKEYQREYAKKRAGNNKNNDK